MRVCLFGTYDRGYSGNQALIEGLRRQGIDVIECHVALWEKTPIKEERYFDLWPFTKLFVRFAANIGKLFVKAIRLPRCPAIITSFSGYLDLPIAKGLAQVWGSKLLFNPMMSIYDTLVLDRQYFRPGSVIAHLILWLERILYTLPDALLVDSQTHFRFFADYLKCPWVKFRRLPLGVDDRVFYPREQRRSDNQFQVLFYGKYQPLQGVVTIIEAAKLLENDPDIHFLVIGYGPTWPEVQRRAQELNIRNINFIKWIEFDQLPEVISQADLCLGIFGVSEKADRCIANKVIQALAMRKPVVTGYTAAMGEVFSDREQVFFCERGNPQALAEAIVELKENVTLRTKIATQGHEAFVRYFSPSAIGALARHYLEEMIGYQR